VVIPESVESIGERAFAYCSSLTSVVNLSPTPQEIVGNVFYDLTLGNITLSVPAESVDTYKAAPVWKDFGVITAYTPSAINAPAAANAIRVHADPATGNFRIEGLAAPAQVAVINTGGQIVWRQTVGDGGSISTAHLPKGVYLVNVNGQTIKIIK
jgi:hypothetical protein